MFDLINVGENYLNDKTALVIVSLVHALSYLGILKRMKWSWVVILSLPLVHQLIIYYDKKGDFSLYSIVFNGILVGVYFFYFERWKYFERWW